MIMILIYGILLIVCIVGLISTISYSKAERKTIDKKEQPLKCLMGLSLFIIDLFGLDSPDRFPKLEDKLQKINLKDKCENSKRNYIASRINLALLMITVFAILGLIMSIGTVLSDKEISSIIRPVNGEGVKDISIIAKSEKESEKIDLEIKEREYTFEEALEIIDKEFDEFIIKFLDKNSSLGEVTEPLNLISNLGEYNNIDITYNILDKDIIGMDGQILYENIPNEGISAQIDVTFKISGYELVKELMLGVYPRRLDNTEQLKQVISKEINENNDIHNDKVILPEEINGDKMIYSYPKEDTNYIFLILLVICISVLIIFGNKELDNKLKNREEEMENDFSEIVSKLTLLYTAGLSINKAFERIIIDYQKRQKENKKIRFAYEEIRLTMVNINNGMSESIAYSEWGRRCGIHSYVKFGLLLKQNLQRGSSDLRYLLEEEAVSAYENKKAGVRKKGEEAGTKLLFPMVMMLLIVMIIIIFPAMVSINI